MGFENILEAFYSNNGKGRTAKSIGQGNSLLNIRESLMNVIEMGREGFREGLTDKKRFKKLNKREKKWIVDLESKYNRLVSDYASSYKNFLTEHRELEGQVATCKAHCLEKYNTNVNDYANKRLACAAGCQIKGPFIAECKDTYTGMRNQIGKKCGTVTPGKCSGGNVTVGQDNYVSAANYADRQGKTIKDGCCECGGGTGGKPAGEINGQEVKRCGDIYKAFGLEKGSGTDYAYRQACYGASKIETGRTGNFYKKYNDIQNKNGKVTGQANKLYNTIDHLENVNKKIKTATTDSETQLADDLKSFEEKYAMLQELGGKYEGGKDPTIEAQRMSVLLKKQSEEMQFYFMSILAIVLVVTTIINFRRPI